MFGQLVEPRVGIGVEPGHARSQDDPDEGHQHDQDDQDFSRGGHHTSPGPGSELTITAQFNLIYLSFKSAAKQ